MTAKTFPQVRKSSLGKVDLSREREWILQHGDRYAGQWVVLSRGRLIGHTLDSNEVAAIVDRARAEGIAIPYVKFISEEREPIWMGWL
ncbi:MAG: hypothetical protein L0229_13880 [Blastocatellia bacterium]|nr:hypothetical protein [Blastocatellia bacterium]